MADRAAYRRLRRRIAVTLAGAIAFAAAMATVAHGATGSLQGWLGNGAGWPQRALVVFAPSGAQVDAGTVHVTENGAKAGPLSITSLRHAGPRDFGLVIVVDRGQSMAGKPLNATMAAVRKLAAGRGGEQQLGVIAAGGHTSTLLPLTSDAGAISHALATTPAPAAGALDLPGAMRLGLTQLAHAHVALGAIVVVSDRAGKLAHGTGAGTSAAVRSAAAAANVPIFTVGVQDGAATARSLASLHSVAGGQLVQAPPARLGDVFSEISATVTRGYVVRWRSAARAGASVDVRATVRGVRSVIGAQYASRAPIDRRANRAARSSTSSHKSPVAHELSARPGFAVPPVATPIPAGTPAAPTASSGFWASGSGTLATAAIVALLFTAMLVLIFYRPSKRAVRNRVISFLPSAEPEADESALLSMAKPRGGLAARLENGNRWPAFVEDVEISGTPLTPGGLVKRAAVAGLLVGLLVMLISSSALLGFVPILGWPWVLRKLYARKARKMRDTFRDLLPIYLQDLASAMRVGRSFVAALTAVTDGADEPLKSALERVITDEALGMPIEEAIDHVAERVQNTDLSQVALIAGLNRKSGSNVAEALDRVAEGARERADLRREIKALTAQAKMSSMVLTALPGLLLVAISLVSARYAWPLFHTTVGIVLLCVGSGMVFMGWKALQKITHVEA